MSTTSSFLLLLLGHVTCCQAWTCSPGGSSLKFVQIDAGMGEVVGTDVNQTAFFKSGDDWYPLTVANIKHVTVGPAGIWGVDSQDCIFKLVAGGWVKIDGRLRQLDAGNRFIVGTNSINDIYCLGNADRTIGVLPIPWVNFPGKLRYYSCGPNGCWGCNSGNQVFIMRTVNPATCQNSNWELVPELALTMIEVGTDGSVFGVSPAGEVYQRSGVSTSNPLGSSWDKIPMCMSMKHVTYDLGRLWVVTTGGFAMVCTQ